VPAGMGILYSRGKESGGDDEGEQCGGCKLNFILFFAVFEVGGYVNI